MYVKITELSLCTEHLCDLDKHSGLQSCLWLCGCACGCGCGWGCGCADKPQPQPNACVLLWEQDVPETAGLS